MRIGLISDTHLPRAVRTLDELGPQVEAFFSTVDLILHAGDIVTEGVLDWLERLAPVIAATGNNDQFCDPRMQPRQFLEVEGWRIGMAHDLEPELRPLAEIERWVFGREVDIIIGGHTHREHIRHDGRHLLVNSGSAVLPRHYETRLGTVGLLELRPDFVHAEVLRLGETPGKRNPGEARLLELERSALLEAS
ncbi:MAG TPA: metallophosphoesterase family protein [Dehalococcoidia bacterium]|nr:metallophosphoesterase family protein [Dehalococcoidia bacterium]